MYALVERERLKNEKQAKYEQKNQNKAARDAAVSSKTKEKKAKAKTEDEIQLAEYVEDTPPGEKKGELHLP
jgi:hypothetical protein